MRYGRKLPDSIANAPSLNSLTLFYFNAFHELATCRQFEGGDIPWTAVKDYGIFWGLDNDSVADLFTVIRLVESELRTKGKSGGDAGHAGKSGRKIGKDR